MTNNNFYKVNTALLYVLVFFGLFGAEFAGSADTSSVSGDGRPVEPSAALSSIASVSSIYAYDEKDLPEFFFFPKEKARWDGSKVSMSEWYMLTELQKEKFIVEYFNQLRKENKATIDPMGMEYLKALNVFSVYSNKRTINEPSVKFIDILLSGQGKTPFTGQNPEAGNK